MTRSVRIRLVVFLSLLVLLTLTTISTWVVLRTHASALARVDTALDERLALLRDSVQPAEADTFDVTVPSTATADPRDGFAVWDQHGRLMTSVGDDVPESRPGPGRSTEGNVRRMADVTPAGATVVVSRRVDDLQAASERLAWTLAGVSGVGLLLVVTGSWWIAGRALAPVATISRTARAMIDGDLTARIPTGRIETELEALAGVLNDAFDRLYESLERQRRFTADASHDLRTPLATLQAEVDWALARPRSDDEYRGSLEVCRRATGRMRALVQALLDLARAESADVARRSPVAVDDVVAQIVGELTPLAQAHSVTVTHHGASMRVLVDPGGLHAAITNLVQNAIQYNVPNGTVVITTTHDDTTATIAVRDTGIGVSEADRAKIFDRFFRVDPARSAGGAGLGLAIVSAFARSHGGRVDVSSTPGSGSTFSLIVPANIPHTTAV
ncbi:MAG: sensor histidine kinase [Vicinamibacterales bacterium]